MRIVVYNGVALWISVGVLILVWNMILDAQMVNNIVPKPDRSHLYKPPRFTFQTHPADYTELGQVYRQKSIRAELLLVAYVPTLFIIILIASRI